MKEKENMKEFIQKNRLFIAVSTILVIFTFWTHATSNIVGIDSEIFINSPGTSHGWLMIGRYAIVAVKKVFDLNHYNPYFAGLLFLPLFLVSTLFWGYLFQKVAGKDQKLPLPIFGGLYVTSQIWCFMFYFSMMQAEIVIAIIAVQVALYLLSVVFLRDVTHKEQPLAQWKKIVAFVFSILFQLVAYGSYQAMVPVFVSGAAALLLLWVLHHYISFVDYLKRGALICCSFVLAFGINSIIVRKWFYFAAAYLEKKIQWGVLSNKECLRQIWFAIKEVVLGEEAPYTSIYGIIIIASLIFLLFMLFSKKIKIDKKAVLLFNTGILLISPFLLTIYSAQQVVVRSHQEIIFVIAFAMMILHELCGKINKKKVFSIAITCISLIYMYRQCSLTQRFYYTDAIRYQQDVILADNIADKITDAGYGQIPDMPIAFVGYQNVGLNASCLPYDVIGRSFFSWDYAPDQPLVNSSRANGFFRAAMGYNYQTIDGLDEEQRNEVIQEASTMQAYPMDGCVRVKDNVMIVKLSEVEG